MYKDIKKLYIFVGKLLHTCNSLHTFNTKQPPAQRGWDYANHPNPEAMHAGGMINAGPCQHQGGYANRLHL